MAERKIPDSVDTFIKGIWRENPVFVMLIGMCPTLAVSNTLKNCIAMGLCASFVLIMSSAFISMLRKLIPQQVRIATFIVVIATFVTMVDYALKAISKDLSDKLGAFVPLIVVNCIILARAEAFASKNNVIRSTIDAIGMSVGFTFALLCLGVVREILGMGTLWGHPVVGPNFEPWAVMVLAPGGFFTLATWLLIFNWVRERSKRKAKGTAE